MAAEWRNNGEPVDGKYIVDVDAEDGSQVQTYYADTPREMADKLAAAQVKASQRINELKRGQAPDAKQQRAAFKPRTLTADEKFAAAQDLRDPNKVEEVIERVVAAQFGAKPAEIAKRLQDADDKEFAEYAAEQTRIFVENTPDWYPTKENKQALWDYMEANNMELTAKNFGIAFDRMTEGGLLEKKPAIRSEAPEENATERIVPQQTTRQRGSFATGVRAQDAGSTPGTKPKPKYTRQDIENMPRSVLAHKMNTEAGFATLVNSM